MQTRDFPPTRKSILASGHVKPVGPHQCITCSASVQAFHTRLTVASKTRVTTRSCFLAAVIVSLVTGILLIWKLLGVRTSFGSGHGCVEKRGNRREHPFWILQKRKMIGAREHGQLSVRNQSEHFHSVFGLHGVMISDRDQDRHFVFIASLLPSMPPDLQAYRNSLPCRPSSRSEVPRRAPALMGKGS